MTSDNQVAPFFEAQARSARINAHFMELVQTQDITADELKLLVKRRPEIWARFSHFIPILEKEEPDKEEFKS